MDIDMAARNVLQQYPVRKAAFFGSAARGDRTEKSDIDMLVEFMPGRGGVNREFFGLQLDLADAFACHVDLITYDALYNVAKPQFRENVLSEMRVIYERES
jgi:predicted nucleotidyltransferase